MVKSKPKILVVGRDISAEAAAGLIKAAALGATEDDVLLAAQGAVLIAEHDDSGKSTIVVASPNDPRIKQLAAQSDGKGTGK